MVDNRPQSGKRWTDSGEVHDRRGLKHRAAAESRVVPVPPELYGVQPRKANAKLKPGRCKGKVHQRDTLGIGGRRILISRDWSGKTLADH